MKISTLWIAVLALGTLGLFGCNSGTGDEINDDTETTNNAGDESAATDTEDMTAANDEPAGDEAWAPQVGKPAPPIAVTDVVSAPEGFPANPSLADFEGEVVVVEFSESWCGPCIQTMPHYNALVEEFEGEDVNFLMISSEPIEAIQKFKEDLEIKAAVLRDGEQMTNANYQVMGYPTVYIVGKDGLVKYVGHPAALTEAMIREHT